jgi:hypothetical protein
MEKNQGSITPQFHPTNVLDERGFLHVPNPYIRGTVQTN